MSLILADYRCDACGAQAEELVARPPPSSTSCPCGGRADRIISAAHIGTVWGAPASRGKSDPRPGPLCLDTSLIADGMSVAEWRRRRAAAWRDHGSRE